jgi:ABC-type nitrate/sulfonate/bicarbonate transport system permease component
MARSNLIRGGRRFPAITTDLREREESSASTPTDSINSLEDPITASAHAAASTWSNSIGLFFGDVIACPSAVVIGREEWS